MFGWSRGSTEKCVHIGDDMIICAKHIYIAYDLSKHLSISI